MIDNKFGQVLAYLRSIADNNGHTKGKIFEKLVLSFLQTDPLYRDKFSDIWLWAEYPYRNGRQDFGVDLVAQEVNGTMCAIQCKFYTRTISKKDIDGLLEAASGSEFDSVMLVYTGQGYGRNVENALKGHKCHVLNFESLASSNVDWPNLAAGVTGIQRRQPYTLRPHQKEALYNVVSKFDDTTRRGQLIMACGTGKTLTSLWIAEQMVGRGGIVLYVVPSIALMQQAIRYWAEQQNIPHSYVGVCSDTKVSHGENDIPIMEMEISVSTDSDRIAAALQHDPHRMKIVFATYQSMGVIVEAQKSSGIKFDLILGDEAHRTTGVEGKSSFTLIHHDVHADKRLYMTATPKVYKRHDKHENIGVYSMDDHSATYGPVMHRLGFSESIDRKLLTDYKVLLLGVAEEYGKKALEMVESTTDEGDVNLSYGARMLGLYRVLERPDISSKPLRTAIVYTNRIRDSHVFAKRFKDLSLKDTSFRCDARHVDGTQNATIRANRIQWLRESDGDPCRLVSNARCLSEGVDVPALDAVCFMNPKSSQVEIIQAVGRVMRKVPGKTVGHVIIPLGVPPGAGPEDVLSNKKSFEMVWNVLRALRSHDERLDVEVNTADLKKKVPGRIKFVGIDREGRWRDQQDDIKKIPLGDLDIPVAALYPKIVDEVGDRLYFSKWVSDVADVVARLQERIHTVIAGPSRERFGAYMKGLRDTIRAGLTESEGVEMLAQHLVTRRIFNTLFGSDGFAKQNPVSVYLDAILDDLRAHGLDTELYDLEEFYRGIERRVEGLNTHDARQPVISELYGSFFKKAFPKMADRLGIVYTPTEIVDFILRSVDYILRENFGLGLTDKNVNIIDPFAGAGTFLARLLSADLGLIKSVDIERKYKHEIFANDIVLLAYYIAAVNAESVCGQRTGKFEAFDGMSLTDTFNRGDLTEHMGDTTAVPKACTRRPRNAKITVIVANPPWSAGQTTANEDNPNIKHPEMERRVTNTYVRHVSHITQKKGLYNSYIQALRWASDRVESGGVIGFVTPSSYLTGNAEAGVRACLYEEFTDIWVFNLRGNVKNKETWKQEGGKIFGSGSREGVAITILVKNPTKKGCTIHYKAVPDYMTREEKLDMVQNTNLSKDWDTIKPDRYTDWLNQRGKTGEKFQTYTAMGSKEGKHGKTDRVLFNQYTVGTSTGRDAWVYNSSPTTLKDNMRRCIDYCNSQNPDVFKIDPKQTAWNPKLSTELRKLISFLQFNKQHIRPALYRPFSKRLLYFDPVFITRPQIRRFYPSGTMANPSIAMPDNIKGDLSTMITDTTPDRYVGETSQIFPHETTNKQRISKNMSNLSIVVPDKIKGEFSVFITDITPDISVVDHGRIFPMKVDREMIDNITDWALNQYRTTYKDDTIAKGDIFYYTYGILHHTGYRTTHQKSLVRGLPRISMAPDFWAFSEAGHQLADLHLNFETCPRYDLGEQLHAIPDQPKNIRFGRKTSTDHGSAKTADQSILIIEECIIYDNIPIPNYKVNGRTPVGWFVDRYRFSTDKKSGITNWPLEHYNGEQVRAIIERLVYVGMESDRIIRSLPIEFETDMQQAPTGLDRYY